MLVSLLRGFLGETQASDHWESENREGGSGGGRPRRSPLWTHRILQDALHTFPPAASGAEWGGLPEEGAVRLRPPTLQPQDVSKLKRSGSCPVRWYPESGP